MAAPNVSESPGMCDNVFPFLALPLELRVRIYHLALTDPTRITLEADEKAYRRIVKRPDPNYGNKDGQIPPNKLLSPNLLVTCRQVYHEAIQIFYGQPFDLPDTYSLIYFLVSIGPLNRGFLRNLQVVWCFLGKEYEEAMNLAAFALLAHCVNLTVLYLFHPFIGWHPPTDVAENTYHATYAFLEAFGSFRGSRDAAVDVVRLRFHDGGSGRVHFRTEGRDAGAYTTERYEEEFRAELRRLLLSPSPREEKEGEEDEEEEEEEEIQTFDVSGGVNLNAPISQE